MEFSFRAAGRRTSRAVMIKSLQLVKEMDADKTDRTDLPRRMGTHLRQNPERSYGYFHTGNPRRYGKMPVQSGRMKRS